MMGAGLVGRLGRVSLPRPAHPARAWLNLDVVWGASLVLTGGISIAMALAGPA